MRQSVLTSIRRCAHLISARLEAWLTNIAKNGDAAQSSALEIEAKPKPFTRKARLMIL